MSDTKTIKGLLIDPEAKTVTEVEHDKSVQQIYELIGARPFHVLELSDRETLYYDDEFLLRDKAKEESGQAYFALVGPDFVYPSPIAGKALILGTDRGGDSTDTKLKADAVLQNLRFVQLRLKGWSEGSSYDTPNGFVIQGPQPQFERIA